MRGIALDIRSGGRAWGEGIRPMGQRSIELGRSLSERIVGSVDQALVVLDCQGRVLLVNPAARALLGVGDDVQDRDAGDLPDGVSDLVRVAAAGEAPAGRSGGEEVTVRIGDLPRVLGVRRLPLAEGESPGEPAGVVLALTDLTRARTAGAESEREVLAGLDRLGRHVAHELRNPVGALKLYALSLERHLDKPAARELAEKIVRAAGTVADLVSEVTAFGLGGRLERTAVHLDALMEECLSGVSERVAPDVRIDRGAMERVVTQADAGLLRRALGAIIANALEAMPSGGTLTVWCARPAAASGGAEVEIGVRDTGAGMSREVQARIFDPFFSTKTNKEATGLGMTIARHVIELHGGRIEVQSRSGGGTAVRVVLPVGEQAEDHGRG